MSRLAGKVQKGCESGAGFDLNWRACIVAMAKKRAAAIGYALVTESAKL
jgi:hypothetical protein